MSNSRRYLRLINRISFLENNLLPRIKTTGNYTKKESDLIRSYVLLVHAEIESYFEDIAKEKILKAFAGWRNHRKKSNCLLSLMTFISHEINWDNRRLEDKKEIEFRINLIIKHYIEKINNNHGIKEDHICKLLLPIGVEISQIDDVWLNTMNNFGAQRGTIAHSTISVQNQIDLVTEKNNVNNNILPEINKLDIIIKAII